MKQHKKFITLLLSFVMVFTMAVPAFAANTNKAPKWDGVKYMALGDSIGAGCKTGSGSWEKQPEYYRYILRSNGQKDWSFSVPYAYPTLVNKAVGNKYNSANSFNGTFPGMRAKDYCYILGALKEKDATGDAPWSSFSDYWTDTWGILMASYYFDSLGIFSQDTKEQFVNNIRAADVISVELGANEFSTFITNGFYYCELMEIDGQAYDELISGAQFDEYLWTFTKDGYQYTPLTNKDGKIGLLKTGSGFIERLINNIPKVGTESGKVINALQLFNDGALKLLKTETQQHGAKEMLEALKTLKHVDYTVYSDLMELLDKSLVQAIKDYRKYWDLLMSKIRELNKDALIIATTVPNPALGDNTMTALITYIVGATGIELEMLGDDQIDAELALKPFLNDMDSYIYNKASKYNYRVADISDVVINSIEDTESYYDEVTNKTVTYEKVYYSMHPNQENQKKIANAIIKQYTAAVAEKTVKTVKKVVKKIKEPETVFCKHENTVVKNKVVATYLTAGFTDNKVCKDCGEVVTAGQIIPRKTLGLADKIFTEENVKKVTDLFKKLIPARSK